MSSEEGMSPETIRQRYALRNQAVSSVLQFFADEHLHPELRSVATPIRELAFQLVDSMQDGPELTVSLRKLVETKDNFVRHYLVTHNFQLAPQNKED